MKPKFYILFALISFFSGIGILIYWGGGFNEPKEPLIYYPPGSFTGEPRVSHMPAGETSHPRPVDALPIPTGSGPGSKPDYENQYLNCIKTGNLGSCTMAGSYFRIGLEQFFFNAPDAMQVSEPESIALVINTTGKIDLDEEMMGLPGKIMAGEVLTSRYMEAEIVGPAFEINPSGRQRRVLSRLNPTRWDWEITPKRAGQHQLEVSLYIISDEGNGEEKPLSERRVIEVTVSSLASLLGFLSRLDPLISLITALFVGIGAVLAWFGISSWNDVSKKPDE